MSKLRKLFLKAQDDFDPQFLEILLAITTEIEALNRKFDTWTGKYDEMDAIDKGQQIADQNNERFGKKRDSDDGLWGDCEFGKYAGYEKKPTLTREQADAVMELYYPSWGFYCEDGKKSGEVLRYVLESMIDEEEQNE
ncbi:MAG TPA: hypothetical protein VMW10_08615 [Alphaproteobacteria bacterium]|nr:hypothetical protein [Alphaproteobacteria bacterium]